MVKNFRTQILRNGELVENTKGQVTLDDEIALEIAIGDKNKYVFVVDRDKNIQVLKPTRTLPRGENVYHLDVRTHHGNVGENEFVYTRYPENGLRVLERHGSRVLITEFSVISQYGKLFLVEQPTHYEELARDGAKILVPNLKWSSLDDLLTSDAKEGNEHRLGIEPARLRKPGEIPARKKALIPELGNKQGYVLWYNAAMGSGCVYTRNGQARIWWPNTPIDREAGGMRTLNEGEIILYPRLREVVRPDTTFRLEIVGEVTVIKPEEQKKSDDTPPPANKPLPEKSSGATA